MADTIYSRPEDYDLEHEGDLEDVAFYEKLISRLKPRRLLELGCGSGRVTVPLAHVAARQGFGIVGVDRSPEMLAEARRKLGELDAATQEHVAFLEGDLLHYCQPEGFDLIIVPCATLSHVLEIENQLSAWRNAWRNLAPGGRFAVHLAMPNLAAYAESLQTPPRVMVEMDIDNEIEDEDGGRRLVRYKTTRYEAHRQRAHINFFYDRFDGAPTAARYSSHFESHVYFPRELELLFRITGFRVEATYGGFRFVPLRSNDRDLVMIGRKDDDPAGAQPHVG